MEHCDMCEDGSCDACLELFYGAYCINKAIKRNKEVINARLQSV